MTKKQSRCLLALLTALCMIICGTVTTKTGMTVRAEDSNTISIILDNIEDVYSADAAGGKVELSGDNGSTYFEIDKLTSPKGTTSYNNKKLAYTFTVNQAKLYLKLTPNEGKEAFVIGLGHGPESDGNYELKAGDNIHVEFRDKGGNNPPGPGDEDLRKIQIIDLQLSYVKADESSDSVVCDRITAGNTAFKVPADFNFDDFGVEVLAITTQEIDKEDQPVRENTVIYAENKPNNFRTGTMIDIEKRDAFSFNEHVNGKQKNVYDFGIEFHADHPENKEEFPGFYIVQITLVKPDYRGISIATQNMPDMFDFGTYNSVDLNTTSEKEPGEISCYYGDKTIKLEYDGLEENTITGIEPYGLPKNAVTVDVKAGTVTVNSDFYDRIPLKVTLSDKTVGYMIVKRIGLDMMMNGLKDGNNETVTCPLHGASGAGAEFPKEYQGKYNLTATFYHSNEEKDEAYELVATLKFKDGKIKMRIVKAYGGTQCNENKDLRGSDYILWSGEAGKDGRVGDDAPVAAYVTAVKAGALSAKGFGGCTFGSGAGIEWISDAGQPNPEEEKK